VPLVTQAAKVESVARSAEVVPSPEPVKREAFVAKEATERKPEQMGLQTLPESSKTKDPGQDRLTSKMLHL